MVFSTSSRQPDCAVAIFVGWALPTLLTVIGKIENAQLRRFCVPNHSLCIRNHKFRVATPAYAFVTTALSVATTAYAFVTTALSVVTTAYAFLTTGFVW